MEMEKRKEGRKVGRERNGTGREGKDRRQICMCTWHMCMCVGVRVWEDV